MIQKPISLTNPNSSTSTNVAFLTTVNSENPTTKIKTPEEGSAWQTQILTVTRLRFALCL